MVEFHDESQSRVSGMTTDTLTRDIKMIVWAFLNWSLQNFFITLNDGKFIAAILTTSLYALF